MTPAKRNDLLNAQLTAYLPLLKVAVVGHTNTGKTSLLRTLTEDVSFGEVSDRPSTTTHVEEVVLLVDGAPQVELYDTPGLEDSIALLERLEDRRGDRSRDWVDVVRDFLDSAEARDRFEQEAKAIRQVLASNVALYVIDARDRVLGKHRDELRILSYCAKPVVPVLNFVASADARTEDWREHLSRVSMHAVSEFDTVVLNETSEQRLFEKMLSLLDFHRPTLEALISNRFHRRTEQTGTAAELVADMLIDCAALTLTVAETDDHEAALERMKSAVRDREQACVDDLLGLFRFRADDYENDSVPVDGGHWGLDLFSPASLKQFGVRAGGGAVAGGLAGLTIDAFTGGLSLGAAAMLGATIGAVGNSLIAEGQRLVDVFRGYTELRITDETLRLLAVRQLDLVRALLSRGHASQDKIRLQAVAETSRAQWTEDDLPDVLLDARLHADWSSLAETGSQRDDGNPARTSARDDLKSIIETWLTSPA